MKINILYIHYLTLLFIVLALFFSLIVMVYAVKHSKLQFFSTWQFPMLLALFLDGIVSLH
jgi:hypothetical protein